MPAKFTYHLASLGCRLNTAETTSLNEKLAAAGGQPDNNQPDLVVLNTCAVTGKAEKETRQTLRRLKRTYPGAILVAQGCAADLWLENRSTAWQSWGIDHLLGNTDKDRHHRHLLRLLGLKPAAKPAPGPTKIRSGSPIKRFIKIQDGCNHTCTYCLITHTRHHSRSRPPADIITDINRASNQGIKEIILTGVDLADYRLPTTKSTQNNTRSGNTNLIDLTQLLTLILDQTTIPRIRLGSINPRSFSTDFVSLWQNPRLMPHFHLSLQSGADSILKRMNRPYTTADFSTTVSLIRQHIPQVLISTDIIVGFPGETDDEFNQTVEYIKHIQFSKLHVFPYSPRPGTPAAKMAALGNWPAVPPNIIKKRAKLLRQLSTRLQTYWGNHFQNIDLNPLWEKETDGIKQGYTKNYLPVTARK